MLDQKYPWVNKLKYTVKVVPIDKSQLRLNRTISFNLSSSQNIRMEDEDRLKNLPINFADQDLLFQLYNQMPQLIELYNSSSSDSTSAKSKKARN